MGLVWLSNNGQPWFKFPLLMPQPGVFHGVLPGFGRDSGGRRIAFTYASQNPRGREHLRTLTGIVDAPILIAQQIHGAGVGVWNTPSKGTFVKGQIYRQADTDALVTDIPGLGLVIRVADCQSVLLMDPTRRVVANVHSGWRGSMQNIIGRTVATMMDRYNCDPGDILAAIAPSLGPCCAQYRTYRQEFPPHYWRYRRSDDLFDFWQMSIDQLMTCGVSKQHIEVSGVCTRCNQHLFYSYRGNRTADRFATVIGFHQP